MTYTPVYVHAHHSRSLDASVDAHTPLDICPVPLTVTQKFREQTGHAPPESANTAKLAVLAESGGALLGFVSALSSRKNAYQLQVDQLARYGKLCHSQAKSANHQHAPRGDALSSVVASDGTLFFLFSRVLFSSFIVIKK